MPRSRSRERRRDRKSRSRSRNKRSRSRSHRRRSRDRDYKDHKRREKSVERYSKRDKYDTHRRRSRERSHEKHRNRSKERDRRRDRSRSRSKRHRSNSSERKSSKSSKEQSNNSVKPIVIIANTNKKNKNKGSENGTNSKTSLDRESFEIANEFSEEGFEQFSRDHGIDFTKIETDEDRIAVHEKMEELLKAHFAAQGKVYPPPKQEKPIINAATGFANDGSFLEQFKKMQEEYKQQQENEKKRQTFENNFKNLPINKRRGGKILKTGIVAKTIVTPEGTITTNSYDSYYKEVQKYKNASSCDSDSKTRPLVK